LSSLFQPISHPPKIVVYYSYYSGGLDHIHNFS
jgi:hypothetical protein